MFPSNSKTPSPRKSRLTHKFKKMMSKVETITEDASNEQQSSPPRLAAKRTTHKVLSNPITQTLTSLTSINDEDLPTTTTSLSKRSFSNLNYRKKEKALLKEEDESYSRFSLKIEMSELNLDVDSLFSFSQIEINDEEELKKKENAVRKLQNRWKMVRIRRNYLKLLRKFKLCEIVIEAIAINLSNKEENKNNEEIQVIKENKDLLIKNLDEITENNENNKKEICLRKYDKTMRKYQTMLLNSIIEGKKLNSRKKKRRVTQQIFSLSEIN